MSKTYLEITYRQGKAFAAYLYLDRRPGDHAARSQRRDHFVVDYTEDGRAIGIEFACVSGVDIREVNQVLAETNAGSVEVFTASADWRAIQWEPARIAKGSALDFSSFLAAPAGRSGRGTAGSPCRARA